MFVTSNTNTIILLLIHYLAHPKKQQAQSNQEQTEQQAQEKGIKLKVIGEQASAIAVSATFLTILVVGAVTVLLEDLSVEMLEYRYLKSGSFIGPITTSSNYIDSTVDNVEAPEKEFTLNYTVWRQETIKLPFLYRKNIADKP